MAAKTSPVTPAVVRWAVEEDGRTLPELAQALKVDVDTLDGWVTGDEPITRGQVTDLARVLQRPRALFFLPRAPEAATLPPTFRHPPGDDRAVSANARRKVRQARRIQHIMSWSLQDDPPIDLPLSTLADDPEEAANKARDWLGVDDSEQESWKDDRTALRAWRDGLDDSGVLVFALEIGRDDVRGFSAWDDHAPLIVYNLSGVTPAARTFTIAHELGHLVTRKDSACVEPRGGELLGVDVERWCEQFASAFLMPRTAIRNFTRERQLFPGDANINDVRAVMRRFRVSARAAALRLINLDYGKPYLYVEVERVFKPAPPPSTENQKIARPKRSVARVREYGGRTLRTVLNRVPPRDAIAALRITVDDVREIANEVPGVRSF